MAEKHSCSGFRTSGHWKGHRCGTSANYKLDGKWYCKQHLPELYPETKTPPRIVYSEPSGCEHAGIPVDEVERLAAELSRCGRKAKSLGLIIFGSSGKADLRIYQKSNRRPLIVAQIEGPFDGGDRV